MKRPALIATALAVTLVAGLAGPALAHSRGDQNRHRSWDRHHKHWQHGHDGEEPGTVTVVADNLNNPRQVIEKHGAIYVAEAGAAGDTCIDATTCFGFTGSVTRYEHGKAERVQTGLFSIGGPEGDVVGLDALTFKGHRLYGIMTGTCALPPGVPAEVTDQLGQVLRLRGGTAFEGVADVSSYECTNDPDGQGKDTNPYGIASNGRKFYVADAGGNSVLKVRKHSGQVSLAAVLSTTGQPVPTSLAIGPDGNLYIGTLNFEGGPNNAVVYKLDLRSGELSEYATGLTFITGLNFGKRGDLYVSELSTGFGPEGLLPDGQIVRIPWGAPAAGRQVIGAGSLHFPTGVAYYKGALYVSNYGLSTGAGTPENPEARGQLVRIEL